MTYRNRTPRCAHGFAIGLIRCEECSGKWTGQKPEPRPPGASRPVVSKARGMHVEPKPTRSA